MRIKKTVTIGTVGAGYPAYLHGNGLEKVGGVDVRLKTICDTNLELAQKVMDRYGYEQMTANFDELLADPEIDVIDIITPPFLHVPMAIKAMRAGKHVFSEVLPVQTVAEAVALIETVERKAIWELLQTAAVDCGLQNVPDDVTEEWREW